MNQIFVYYLSCSSCVQRVQIVVIAILCFVLFFSYVFVALVTSLQIRSPLPLLSYIALITPLCSITDLCIFVFYIPVIAFMYCYSLADCVKVQSVLRQLYVNIV